MGQDNSMLRHRFEDSQMHPYIVTVEDHVVPSCLSLFSFQEVFIFGDQQSKVWLNVVDWI
jgi:hypothetical protein